MPELYPDAVDGPYTVPSGTDIADGPQAFRDFADSLGGLSDVLEVFDLAGDHAATAVEIGGLFTHSGTGMTLTIADGLVPVGSVFAVSNLSDEADAAVTVETPNLTETVAQYAIMSFTQVQQDVWIPNGGGSGGGPAFGTPGAPVITQQGGSLVKFTAGAEGDAGPTIYYGATIEPAGPELVVEIDDPAAGGEVSIFGGTLGTSYVVSVYGINNAGIGETSETMPFTLNFNAATGGAESTVLDYNGTGDTYKLHKYETAGTFSFDITNSPNDFTYLIVGGGAGGGGGSCGAGGGGGGTLEETGRLKAVSTEVRVGNHGGGSSASGTRGQQSWLADKVVEPGEGGGGGYTAKGGDSGNGFIGGNGSGQPCGGGAGAGANGGYKTGGAGVGTMILGNSTEYRFGGGGGGGSRGTGHGVGPDGGGDSIGQTSGTRWGAGGGGADFDGGGANGYRGAVIIAYKIGETSTRQIEQARAERAARAAGYEDGLVDGAAAVSAVISQEVSERAIHES
jgi:hypothetical protein